jgi:uncharacterized membrane protein YfcA
MMVLGYTLALLIGISLGLLGGGGSMLTVPVLHYVLGYEVKAAIPMSLVVVGLTSAFGALNHARTGAVRWRTALAFGPPAIVGAVLGAELGLQVEPAIQLTVFAIVMLGAAVAMLRRGNLAVPSPSHRVRPLPFITLAGALVGLLTGFVGVGGGFLYVPALVLLGGLVITEAVGTSLVLIVLSCVAGFLRYLGQVALDWQAIALFTAIAFLGVALGSRVVPHVSQRSLQRGFAFFLLAMGALVLVRGR